MPCGAACEAGTAAAVAMASPRGPAQLASDAVHRIRSRAQSFFIAAGAAIVMHAGAVAVAGGAAGGVAPAVLLATALAAACFCVARGVRCALGRASPAGKAADAA